MPKHMIFYIPMKFKDGYISGSSIRPQKMVNAFKEIGYEVDIVWGTSSERKHKIDQIKQKIEKGITYDFLYAENNTTPALLSTDPHHIPRHPLVDRQFFAYLRRKNIAMGIFYRDLYWRYPKFLQPLSWWKRKVIVWLQLDELNLYEKLFDVLFLPSLRCVKPLGTSFNREIVALPPGCNDVSSKKNNEKKKLQIFYVGGIGDEYDIRMFLKIVSEIEGVEFTVCTRKKDWNLVKDDYGRFIGKNITLIHESGESLRKFYEAADVACLFFKPSEYMGLAMPVKLFEYIGNKLPIISCKNTAAADFISANDIGWTINYDEDSLRKLINDLVGNREMVAEKRNNIEKIIPNNTWCARAEEVARKLLGVKK